MLASHPACPVLGRMPSSVALMGSWHQIPEQVGSCMPESCSVCQQHKSACTDQQVLDKRRLLARYCIYPCSTLRNVARLDWMATCCRQGV